MADDKRSKGQKPDPDDQPKHDTSDAEDQTQHDTPSSHPRAEHDQDEREATVDEATAAHQARVAASSAPEIPDDSVNQHPLAPPYAPSVDVEGRKVLVLESTMGIHDFKLEWIDPEKNVPVGYGWFDASLAAELLGQPFPDDMPARGSQHPSSIMASGRAHDRSTLAALDGQDGRSDMPPSRSADGDQEQEVRTGAKTT